MRVDRPFVQHPALDAFALVAADFCQTLEARKSIDPKGFVATVHRTLPVLYAAALALPSTDTLFVDDDDPDEEIDVAAIIAAPPDPDLGRQDDWRSLYEDLGAIFGQHCSYREVFDPYEPPADGEVVGSLADDLADIYRDVRCGLRKWRRGETGGALLRWRQDFEIHWGEHATGALRALWAWAAWHDCEWPTGTPPESGPPHEGSSGAVS